MSELVLRDPNEPEKGFMLVGKNRFIPEYEHKLGELSVTDGEIREDPAESEPETTTQPPRPDV